MSMTREEWTRRFAARIQEVAGWSAAQAMECAEAAADSHEHNERQRGGSINWLDPEDDADVEMSYWEDDGED